MQVRDGIDIKLVTDSLLEATCTNFCPYLGASQRLGMDTRDVCKKIGEPSIKAFMKRINPNLVFWRDYEKIRPYSEFCMDFVGRIE